MSHRLLIAALVGGLTAPLAACGGHDAAVDPRTRPPVVRIATAPLTADGGRQFTGVISARVESQLGFRVPGKIVERLVDTGQTVRRGQPLMRIDATDYVLAQAAQDQSVAAARARAVQTEADEARYRDLVAAGAVSGSTYDQIKAAALAARAQLQAAEAQARVSRNTAGYAVLVADADGVVVETQGEPGQVVAAGQTVVRLAHAGPREATIALPETLRPAVGSPATASVFGNDAAASPARLRQISDAADPRTRTFEARYVLDGALASAPLGATVTIALPGPAKTAGRTVPLAAIYDAGKGPGVWIVDPKTSTVSWRAVRLAAFGEETATVSQGLTGGERFVALGVHMLHQGQRVSPQDLKAEAAR
ncbi:efflux RND transporter periplasmic adaptor subunit [Caulobacter sp. RL271]|jgi:RND family efflux transporter MFP subunit|uniref:Efflux RND transporter periplasmic adaptor subunit n=1 Tax=Caulobacter segnis TaxID=88688 RepID=A0ABY4ZRH2_9CAUL|nr:efflux RND transporter periplasmic adaptor subunit [Caulobacter segnis]USQ95203.1 efflux RND transporter periplasmic adaptor subunit [Caulobacter segnis]